MVRLFLDTSSDYLSIVLTNDCVLVSVHRTKVGRRMNEILHKAIDDFLSTIDISVNDIDEFYAVTGPGSFTGVRIGVAMVMGLAEGAGKPCYGLSSLDLMALSAKVDSRADVISALKGNIYALKSYDFNEGIFSDYKSVELDNTDDYIHVNTHAGTYVLLEQSVTDDRFIQFRTDCVPLYLRKSEVEITADNKG